MYTTNITCGRSAFSAASKTKTATVPAGSNVGFRVMEKNSMQLYIIHPGPAQIYLSRAPNDDIEHYQGDGDFFKIATIGPANDTEWTTRDQSEVSEIPPATSRRLNSDYPCPLVACHRSTSRFRRPRRPESTFYESNTSGPKIFRDGRSGMSTAHISRLLARAAVSSSPNPLALRYPSLCCWNSLTSLSRHSQRIRQVPRNLQRDRSRCVVAMVYTQMSHLY